MKNLKTVLLSVALVCTTVVVAQDLPNRGPAPFAIYDADGSGSISKDEFDSLKEKKMNQKVEEGKLLKNAGSSPVFEDIDTNKDGNISKEELKIFQDSRLQQRGSNMPMGNK